MSIARTDPYAILGIPRHATQAEISHAYRSLLRRHHPDTRTAEDEAQRRSSDTTLAQVLAAYAVLHDTDRRAEYDRQTVPPRPVRREPQRPPIHRSAAAKPPIVAGPVYWQPPTDWRR